MKTILLIAISALIIVGPVSQLRAENYVYEGAVSAREFVSDGPYFGITKPTLRVYAIWNPSSDDLTFFFYGKSPTGTKIFTQSANIDVEDNDAVGRTILAKAVLGAGSVSMNYLRGTPKTVTFNNLGATASRPKIFTMVLRYFIEASPDGAVEYNANIELIGSLTKASNEAPASLATAISVVKAKLESKGYAALF